MTFRRRLALAAAAILAACGPTSQPAGPLERLPASLVESRGEVTERLLRSGGVLVADYGGYQLIDVSAQGAVQAAPGEVQVRDEYRFLQLNAGAIDTSTAQAASLRGIRSTAAGRQLHLVQLRGPVQPRWYQALAATGARIVTAIPHNAYLLYGDAEAMVRVQRLAGEPFVKWDGAFLDDYKIHPAVHDALPEAYAIQMVEDPESNPASIALARQGERRPPVEDHSLGYTNLVAFIDRASALRLALRPDVVSIHPYFIPQKRDERQDMIVSGNLNAAGTAPSGPGYLAWLAGKGFTQAQFTASGFAVDITDSGLDNATPAAPNHFGLYQLGNVLGASRVVYARLEGSPNGGSTIQGCDGHGTINAHIVGGYVGLSGAPHTDPSGFAYGLGVAPWVKLASSVIFDPNSFTSPDYEDMLSRGFRDGTRISSNSWGARTGGAYNSDSQRYDALVRDAQPATAAVPAPGNQEMAIVFAAGNSGSAPNTVGSPGTAKNVISSGASENNHLFGGPDQCTVPDSAADSPMDVAFFSSRGPLDDGRVKPDLMAPGTHVSGGVAQAPGQRANPPANPNGLALSCFDGSGVCAGSTGNFHPPGQQWTTASSGTSHSTPATAGGAALVRQHFINQGLPPPSPAMSKAVLMNSARYMNGTGANDTLPSNNQGMGLMDLGRAFDSTPRQLRDQLPADLFTASGQVRSWTVFAADSSQPLRLTLAWTDAPGPTAGNAYLNNLDLSVTAGGTTYRGNVFAGGASAPGGAADLRNNVESVFLPTVPSGAVTVTVTATNINSDGVPGNASPLDQDFALVIYNACGNQPASPGGLSASVPGTNRIQLAWASSGAPAYNVYRSFTAGGPYTLVGTSATASFLDSTVSGGSTYFYVVRALDCAESGDSNEASATATGDCTLPPSFAGLSTASNAQASTCGVNLAWAAGTPACGGSLTYNVYRSTSPTFTPSLANRIATGQAGTSYGDVANLQSGAAYYYVVRTVEAAVQTVEDPNTVRRSTAPTGAVTPGVDYFDDLDGNRPPSAAAYWLETTQLGPEQLNLATNCRFQSAGTAYKFGPISPACSSTYGDSIQNRLVLGGDGTVSPAINGFAFPAGSRGTLTFRHAYSMEVGFDGAILQYSTTGAAGPFTNVGATPSPGAPHITGGGYDGNVGGSPAWTGANLPGNGALMETTVNLDGLAGRTAWFGVRYVTDGSVVAEGHYLDEVRIQSSVVAACTPVSTPPGPAGSFTVTLPPSASAGSPVVANLEARDGAGQRATGYNGTAALASSDPQAVMPGSVSFASGVATVPVELRTIGTQTLTATDGVDPALTGSATITITSGPPASIAYLAQPADALAGQPIGPLVRVEVRDALGNLVTVPTPVTMAIENNPGGGTLRGTTTQNTSSGVATFGDLGIDLVANGYTLRASTPGVAPLVSVGFNISAGPAAAVEITAQPTSAQAGVAIAPAVGARIRDAFGNLVVGWATPVVAAIGTNPGGGTLSGTTSRAPVAGVVTFDDLSIDRSGAGYTLRLSSGALTSATSSGFAISSAAPDRVAITRQPSNAVAGTPFAPTVQAQVRDRFDNLCASDISAITASLGNANGAVLLGTATVNAAGGVVTFPDLAVDRVGTGYVLNLDGPGLARGVSTAFAITTGLASVVDFPVPPADTAAGASIAPAVQVSVTDAFRNPIAGAVVAMALDSNPTGATLGGTLLQTTSASGIATFPDLSLRTASAGYTLRATAGSLRGISPAFAITPAAAAGLEVTTQPSNIAAGSAIAPALAVRVRDAFGNTVTGYAAAVDASLSANPPGNGTLSGTASRIPVGGVATFDDLTIDKAGNGYRIGLASGTLPAANTALFNVSPGAPAQLAVSRQPSSSVAGVAFSPTVQGLVQDQFGNLISGATTAVTASLGNAGQAALLGTGTVSAVNGVVTFPDLAVDLVGTGYVLHLDAAGLTRGTSAAFGISPAAPSRLEYSAQPSDVVAGAGIAPAVRVAARDAFGNLATSFASLVTVSLATNPNGGVLSGTRSSTAVAGVATFSTLTLDKAGGGYSLNASASGLAPALSGPFAVLPAAADRLAFGVQPSRTVAGAGIAPAIQVQLLDRFGNLSTSTAPVTLAIQANPGGGTLAGTATVAAAGGVATFADLSINRSAVGYRLSAASAGLTGALSTTFDIDAGPPAGLGFRVLPAQVVAGAAISPAVAVEVRDALGNVVRTASPTTVTVDLGANPGGGTLMGTTTGATVNGVASFGALSIQRAAAGYTLTANAPSLAQGESGTFAVVAANPSALAFTTPPGSTTAAAPFAVAVEAQDAFGNRATGYSGTVTLALGSNPAGGALAGMTSAAASGGAASFGALSIARAGAGYTLTAAASGLTGAASAPFDIAAGPAAALELSGLAATVTAWSETTFSVRAVDGSGNLAVDLAGAATVASSDPTAVLPASVAFSGGQAAGLRITFKRAGSQTVTVSQGSLSVTGTVTVGGLDAPTVSISAPAEGAKITGEVTITASGTVAATTTLTQIEIFVDGTSIGTGTASPASVIWNTAGLPANSPHQLTAVITDATGASASSAAVNVVVGGGCGCGAGGGSLSLAGLAALALFRRRRATGAAARRG